MEKRNAVHYIILETAFGNMLAIQSSRDFVLITKKMPIHPVGKVSLLEDSIGDTFHVSIKRSWFMSTSRHFLVVILNIDFIQFWYQTAGLKIVDTSGGHSTFNLN